MKQTRQLLQTLKHHLRQRGITYRQLAGHLELSEASVKRLFSEHSFTLERLEKSCELAGLDISDLVDISRQQRNRLEALSTEQEAEIASDVLLLLVAISVINGFSFDDLLKTYTLTEHECIRKLARLDQMKILDLLPGNRIRLRVAPNFQWRANGPIQQYFHQNVQQEFFNSRFHSHTEKLLVLNGVLTRSSNARLQELMESIYEEFNHLMRTDNALAIEERKGNTMVIALRQWQYPVFRQFMKNPHASTDESQGLPVSNEKNR